jgi:hypothetical protein
MNVTTTHVFILSTLVAWAVFDLFALALGGVGATISRSILAWHWRYPWVSFAAGLLIGHLFFPQPRPPTS